MYDGASWTYLSKTTVPFEPTAKSGNLSPLWSKDDWLIDMPKNFSPDLTSGPAILCVNWKSLIHQIGFILNTVENRKPYFRIFYDLAHLWIRKTDSSSSFAVEYVDAALTIILQRSSNGQIIETISVKIRQYSKRRPKPSFFRCIPS